jgi:glucan endo-1,3-alpha-glucosidase
VPVATTSALPAATTIATTLAPNATLSTGVNATAPLTLAPNATATTLSPNATLSVTTTAAVPTSTLPVHETEDKSEWYSLGCTVDSDQARVLTGYIGYHYGYNTVDDCLSFCEDKGYKFAGVEYGNECHCGSSIPSTLTSTEWCNVPCDGDKSETCGGGWALDLYELMSTNDTDCAATTIGGILVPIAGTTTTGKATTATAVATTAVGVTTAVSVTTAAPQSTTVPSSSDAHQVWAHHMVGNTYSYSQSNWATDISKAQDAGIDGFALNMGIEDWQISRVSDAYAAAAGTGFKLFLSLDMTSLQCGSWNDAANLVNIVQRFAGQSAQAMHNSKALVSTFAGSDCHFGQGSSAGWQSAFVDPLKSSGVPIFFMPSIFSDIGTFASNTWMDGEVRSRCGQN